MESKTITAHVDCNSVTEVDNTIRTMHKQGWVLLKIDTYPKYPNKFDLSFTLTYQQ